MKPVWLHDLRLAWRHPEIRREVLALTAWKAASCIHCAVFWPILLLCAVPYLAGKFIAASFEFIAATFIHDPAVWIRNRRTPYYRPIREKLEAKGAMQWQIKGLKKPHYYDSPRADGQ